MARQVFILLPSTDDGAMDFALRKSGETLLILPQEFEPQADDVVTAFAPAGAATAHRAIISARSEKEAFLSAPYTIEDDLAQPVEMLHVALGPRVAAGQARDLYVVDSALMSVWEERLDELGLRHARIVPELSVIPDTDGIIAFDDRYLVSTKDRRYGVDLSFSEDLIRALTAPNGEELPLQRVTTHSLVKLAELLPADISTDFRQGRFSRRSAGAKPDLQSFGFLVGILAACVIAWIGYLSIQTATLNSETRRLRTDASNLYTAVFPGEANVPDPAQRIRERNSGGAEADLDFRTVAAALYEATLAVNGAQIRSLRYDAKTGMVRASLSYAAYGDDARLRQALEGSGLVIQIGDSRQEQGRVIGDLVLEASK